MRTLRGHAAEWLPDYMVPSAFVPLHALPVTPSGKIDAQALPAPDYATMSSGRAPRTAREKLLCALYAEVLGLDAVTVEDDFLALGGDSISAIQLLIRARGGGPQAHHPRGVPAPYGRGAGEGRRRAGRRGTAADDAARRRSTRPNSPRSRARARCRSRNCCRSPRSSRASSSTPSPAAPTGTPMSSSRSSTSPDRSTGRRCAAPPSGLLDRHAPLRAAFRQRPDGTPVQIITRDAELPWREVDLSSQDGAVRESLGDAVAADERAHGFDLAAPPLLRCALVRLGEERSRLILTFHHIVADGWSLPVLHRELMAFYGTDAPPLPEVAPYRGFLRRLAGQDRDAARDAWRDALAGLDEPTRLVGTPARRRRPCGPSTYGWNCPSGPPRGSPSGPASTASPSARSSRAPGVCCSAG